MAEEHDLFFLRQGNVYALPTLHYNMEMAAQVYLAFQKIRPACVAVELAQTMELQLLHAASRLPDISVVVAKSHRGDPLYYLCEPCDGAFEALRCALEHQVPAHCIDLDVEDYPEMHDLVPDPYALTRIGFKSYYHAYRDHVLSQKPRRLEQDHQRESFMAWRLKELSLRYDSVLFVGGLFHVEEVLRIMQRDSFPSFTPAIRPDVQLCTLTEESCRDVLAEFGWISRQYEESRQEAEEDHGSSSFPPDRQKLLLRLYQEAATAFQKSTGNSFHGYHLRNTMKFVRNYALVKGQLMPDLFKILTAAKSCVEHNYAYEVWLLATEYPYLRNVDNLPQLNLSIEEVWGHSKIIRFHMKEQSRKGRLYSKRPKDTRSYQFDPPGPFSICSYQPEDLVVENFGEFLKKKGTQILMEEAGRTIPFSSSLEDGIDFRETIRHWTEHKLYVKVRGKPPGGVGSVVVIFDEDDPNEGEHREERYPWRATWLGEHSQESDMALYATPLHRNIVGPGISRCEYGGFLMSYPPRRMFDVWADPDYSECRNKPEVLLTAAIDYAVQPLVVYVAATPPRSLLKSFASRFGKKIVYIPIGQLSPITLNKIRTFHVLDGHDRRRVADDYIF